MSEVTQDIFRLQRSTYQALLSRFGRTTYRRDIAVSSTIRILPKNDRHSLRIRNVGSADLRIGTSSDAASGTTAYIELRVGDEKYYRIHYLALQAHTTDMALVVFHCEWDDELWVRNPSAVQAGTIEVEEVY